MLLSHHAVTFILGTHFNCPPHMWDDLPPERVFLHYLFVIAAQKQEQKQMEKMEKDSKRYNANSNQNKGRPIRTTSDSANLADSFDLMNAKMRESEYDGLGSESS